MPRRRVLTEQQAALVRERYTLYRANTPKRIARELGVGERTLYAYLRGYHKQARTG